MNNKDKVRDAEEQFENLGYIKEEPNNDNVIRFKNETARGTLVVAFNLELKIWRHYRLLYKEYTAWGVEVPLHIAINKFVGELGWVSSE